MKKGKFKPFTEADLSELMLALNPGHKEGDDMTTSDFESGIRRARNLMASGAPPPQPQELSQAQAQDESMAARDAREAATLPVVRKLEEHLKAKGLRMLDLFEMMLQVDTGEGQQLESDHRTIAAGSFTAVVGGLVEGGWTAEKRAEVKRLHEAKARQAERQAKLLQEQRERAAAITAAEETGAGEVLRGLSKAIETRGLRLIDLFNMLDTSQDGCISHDELKQGVEKIANRKHAAAQSEAEKKEQKVMTALRAKKQATEDLRQRISAAENASEARVLARIDEYLVSHQIKVVQLFKDFTLSGDMVVSNEEVELGLALMDGMGLTQREVRMVCSFLDTDNSGTINLTEFEEAVRQFRRIRQAEPELGSGAMTLYRHDEIAALAEHMFVLAGKCSDVQELTDDGCAGLALTVEEVEQALATAQEQAPAGFCDKAQAVVKVSSTLSSTTSVAKASADKVTAWAKASKLSRAPTGRIPLASDKMGNAQKLEIEIQRRNLEKKRRVIAQHHWEQWSAKKARVKHREHRKQAKDDAQKSNQITDQEAKEKAAAADACWKAWADRKDKEKRAIKREQRRKLKESAAAKESTKQELEEIKAARHRSRSPTPMLPPLTADSSIGGASSHVGGSSLAFSQTTIGPNQSKMKKRDMDLAMAKVALSPYAVDSSLPFSKKHIYAGQTLQKLQQSRSLPSSLVQRGKAIDRRLKTTQRARERERERRKQRPQGTCTANSDCAEKSLAVNDTGQKRSSSQGDIRVKTSTNTTAGAACTAAAIDGPRSNVDDDNVSGAFSQYSGDFDDDEPSHSFTVTVEGGEGSGEDWAATIKHLPMEQAYKEDEFEVESDAEAAVAKAEKSPWEDEEVIEEVEQ
ncbi:unnamed protein product [Chrysoparadoxa australica]